VRQILSFETGLYTGQVECNTAGLLNEQEALGGPQALLSQEFFIGINNPVGHRAPGVTSTPRAFMLYEPWKELASLEPDTQNEARLSVMRGEGIFNSKSFTISSVAGLNDDLNQPRLTGTCATCHNTPNVGSHSLSRFFNIGVSDAERRTPEMPLYSLRNKATGEIVQTTDPGRALISGRWKDVARFKVPILRGLASRAPYFHDGSAATIGDTVDFYEGRFQIGLTAQEREDLISFLHSL
jgi:hypothetical protein